MLHLFPRVLHYIMEIFTPLDWEKLNLQYTYFRFVWTQRSMIIWFWYTYCLDHMNALFMKFYRFMRTTLEHWSTLARNAAQAIPLKNLASRTGEGHSFQTVTVATLQVEKKSSVLQVMHWLNDWQAICDHWSQHVLKRHKSGRLDVWPKLTSQLCRNYPDISWINSNSVQFMETWPDMAHNIARFAHICMLVLWSLIQPLYTFWGGKSRLCQTFAENAHILPQNFKPKTLLGDFWPFLPDSVSNL